MFNNTSYQKCDYCIYFDNFQNIKVCDKCPKYQRSAVFWPKSLKYQKGFSPFRTCKLTLITPQACLQNVRFLLGFKCPDTRKCLLSYLLKVESFKGEVSYAICFFIKIIIETNFFELQLNTQSPHKWFKSMN